MYVRMTGGRDRGAAKEFSFENAQELLRSGQAVPVNFEEPDPLGKRVFEVRDAQSQIAQEIVVPTSQQTEPAVVANAIAQAAKHFEKRPTGKKAR